MKRKNIHPFDPKTMELDAKIFRKLDKIQDHLGFACIKGLKSRQFKTIITDAFNDDKTLKGGMLLAVAIELSRWIKTNIPEKRVGIVLPPSIGAMLANMACSLCNKTPVNLNFSTSRESNESAIRQAKIKTILTADTLVKKYSDFPWTDQRFDLPSVLKSFSKARFLYWRSMISLLPANLLAKMLGIPQEGGKREAALLFTSGSSGEPKGVVLSHQNILANVAQIDAVLPQEDIRSILGCLPIFHSFGFTVTLWWPIISGPRVVTYISPLEIQHLAEIIERFQISLLITTPTFLRGFLKRSRLEQLKSLQMIVTGAEKLPSKLREAFETKFKIPVCEGYGMTETTPVISVNLLDFPHAWDKRTPFRKHGTVGRLLPGIAVRSMNSETQEFQSPKEKGLLWFYGANVFNGYLNNPVRNAAALKDGWYCSGDIGHLDDDGFLTIEGRQSRFSKIGGEMVPHGIVEQRLNEICSDLEKEHDHLHAVVMGVSDPAKGEFLVALVTPKIDAMYMRKKLAELGLPNLWIPKMVHRVRSIPTLASGKLDLAKCQKIADEVYQSSHPVEASGAK